MVRQLWFIILSVLLIQSGYCQSQKIDSLIRALNAMGYFPQNGGTVDTPLLSKNNWCTFLTIKAMIKKFLTLIFTLLIFISVQGQDNEVIDSLNRALHNKVGGDQYPALHRLAVEYADIDNEKALDIIIRAGQVALLSGDSLWIVKSQRAKSQILFRLNRLNEALQSAENAYAIASRLGFTEERMLITNTSGCAYALQGRFDLGLDCFFELYEIALEQGDSSALSMSMENIGIAYYKLHDYKKGLQFLMQSLALDNSKGVAGDLIHVNISLCYTNLGKFTQARRSLKESINSCGPACGDLPTMHIEYASGVLLAALDEYDSAEVEFLKSYAIAKRLGDRRIQLDNIYLLTDLYIRQKRFDEAVQLLRDGEEVTRHGIPFNMEVIKIYARLSELMYSTMDFKSAAFYQRKYIRLKDSIYNDAHTTGLMKVESKFLERENRERIVCSK